ncbi:membrane fusion protein (multidrug efflux system) [Plasticicumulans lactativorans]|uniref:Membrane fusion protein (Multidrug efflux system) n=1 Tax=Plasticicumulans lactativorans TaxID=1133106 RepID=A0A4R2L930_9GAMM|nr:efflux RND transporter periplasmic adaptor subunit [Plasticicumulans lactativorans]TCO82655.1 membrane fusion protein (multidrug efflux system) [Plasticicumulans lactativorans]
MHLPLGFADVSPFACRRVLAGAFVAVLGWAALPAGAQEARPPAPVSYVEVVPRNTPKQFEYTGKTESSRQVEVRARVEGYLDKIAYIEGSVVRTGDLMFQIDPRPFQAALDNAKGALAQAQAKLTNATATLKRVRPLAKENALSQKDLDDAVAAELEAKAAVVSAQAGVRNAELNLEYTTIRSPLNGLSGRSTQREGSLVQPASSQPLTTLVQLDPMWVNFGIGENDVLRYRTGIAAGTLRTPGEDKVEIELVLANGQAYPLKGRINYVDPVVDAQTGTLNLRAEVPNPQGVLSPGQFVRVRIQGIELVNAVLVPQRAVLQGPQGKFVYVIVDGDKAEARPVEVGEFYGDQWIVPKGLKAGDKVVVDGAIKLAPGAPVKVLGPATETPAAPK